MTKHFNLPQPSHKATVGFYGKAAIIKGASSGLGWSFVSWLHDKGADCWEQNWRHY
jgi:NADP-dependent 3-hydroxy acid dehydrogenase YdfG